MIVSTEPESISERMILILTLIDAAHLGVILVQVGRRPLIVSISATTDYRQFPAENELLSYSTGAILALHWGTLHRTIRTKDAAIAGFGAEQRLTANAFVEELTGVGWHRFAFCEAANRTYQHGFQNKLAHTKLSLPAIQTRSKSGACSISHRTSEGGNEGRR